MPAPAGEGLTRRAGCQTLSSPRIHPVLPEGLDVPVHLRVDRTPLSSSPHQHTGRRSWRPHSRENCVSRGGDPNYIHSPVLTSLEDGAPSLLTDGPRRPSTSCSLKPWQKCRHALQTQSVLQVPPDSTQKPPHAPPQSLRGPPPPHSRARASAASPSTQSTLH